MTHNQELLTIQLPCISSNFFLIRLRVKAFDLVDIRKLAYTYQRIILHIFTFL